MFDEIWNSSDSFALQYDKHSRDLYAHYQMAANSNVRRRSLSNSRRKDTASSVRSDRQRVREVERTASGFIQVVRAIIFGLGASAIAGTAISIIDPPKQQIATHSESPPLEGKSPAIGFDSLKLTRSSLELTALLQGIAQKNSQLAAHYLFVDLDSGEYAAADADRVFPAASTIKLPILIALFQDVDLQKVQLAEQLTIDRKSIAEGSGDLQDRPLGSKVSVLVAATKMMTISDNTATNLIIDRLGGKLALNERFRTWGLKVTAINNRLPDLEGKNITTASELARTIVAIDRGKIVSDAARSHILKMMSNNSRNTMLPQGLDKDAKIAHKTGDIGKSIADVGAIELPSGKIYIAAVLVKRPYNDPAGPELVRKMSKIVYQYFLQQHPTTTSSPKPTISPNPSFPKTRG